MTGPFDEQRLAADLRRAAESFEPDSDRIAELVRVRTAPVGPVRAVARPADGARRGRAGRVLTFAAAAASVVFAITAADVVLRGWAGPDPSTGAPATALTSSSSSSQLPVAAGTTTSTDPTTTTSTDPTTTMSKTPATSTAPRRVTSRTTSAPPPTAGRSVEKVVGGRAVTVTVTPVSAGTAHVLGADGDQWVTAPATPSGSPFHGRSQGWPVGPVQLMGSGGETGPGPFAVSWRDGLPAGAGRSSTWFTAPHDVRGAPAGLRVPVRHGPGTVTVTLLVGTVGGGGRLTLALPAGEVVADLPACSASVCPAVVRIVIRPSAGGTIPSGDVMVDLAATAADGRIGFAAAELGD